MARDDDQRVAERLLEVVLKKAKEGEVTASDLIQLNQVIWLRSIAAELSFIRSALDGIKVNMP